MLIGPIIALGCAITWAIALILWEKVGPGLPARALNCFKNGFSLLLLVPTLFLIEGPGFPEISRNDLLIILVSGSVGIGIADGLYLWSLELIGPSRLAIIDCLYTPTVVLVSWFFLGERVNGLQILGGLMVLVAALLVSVEKSMDEVHRTQLLKGCLICTGAILVMTLGIVGLKPVFPRVSLFWIVTLRLGIGFIVSLLGVLISSARKNVIPRFLSVSGKKYILLASFCGTYLSMVLWVAGFKYNQAAIAAILNQTSTVFTVVLAAYYLDEKLTKKRVLAVITSMAGVFVLTMN